MMADLAAKAKMSAAGPIRGRREGGGSQYSLRGSNTSQRQLGNGWRRNRLGSVFTSPEHMVRRQGPPGAAAGTNPSKAAVVTQSDEGEDNEFKSTRILLEKKGRFQVIASGCVCALRQGPCGSRWTIVVLVHLSLLE